MRTDVNDKKRIVFARSHSDPVSSRNKYGTGVRGRLRNLKQTELMSHVCIGELCGQIIFITNGVIYTEGKIHSLRSPRQAWGKQYDTAVYTLVPRKARD